MAFERIKYRLRWRKPKKETVLWNLNSGEEVDD